MGALKEAVKKALPPGLRPQELARQRILRYAQGKVVAGPFAGQIYTTSPDDFIEPAMFLGLYEREIYPFIEKVLASPPATFIDIGAAQGYYSVGFARRVPQARHVAFEMHAPRVEQLKRTAKANGVSVELYGECTTDQLQNVLQPAGDAFILIDVEGAENFLLDPVKVPLLKNARIIIETHDHLVPGTTAEMRKRFGATHDIETVESEPRTRGELPFLICDRWTLGQADEGRGVTQIWLVLTPRRQS